MDFIFKNKIVNFSKKTLRDKRGVSLVEILIALSILVIILSVVLPEFSKIRENQVLKNGVVDILSAINKARGATLASLNSSEYGVHFESDAVVIFKGQVFSELAVDNEIIDIFYPAVITNVTLNGVSGNTGEFYFSRLRGVPSATGSITISNGPNSQVITISATGVASAN